MVQPAEMDAQPAGTLDAGGLRRVLVVLCVTEIVSWGVLYYAFPVLAPSIAADTGWSVSMITAGFPPGWWSRHWWGCRPAAGWTGSGRARS